MSSYVFLKQSRECFLWKVLMILEDVGEMQDFISQIFRR